MKQPISILFLAFSVTTFCQVTDEANYDKPPQVCVTDRDFVLRKNPINVMTINGDGINDEFTFRHLADKVNYFHCVIVNRWGQKQFKFNSVEDVWRGMNLQGDLCSPGVYFFVYEAEGADGIMKTGEGNIQIVGSCPVFNTKSEEVIDFTE